MFEFRAAYVQPPGGNGLPPVRITLPDGTIVTSDLPNLQEILSRELGREVALAASAPDSPSLVLGDSEGEPSARVWPACRVTRSSFSKRCV